MSNFKYFKEELSVFLLDARKPLICIETSDWLFVKDRMKEVIKGIDDHGNGQNALDIKSIYVWDAAYGYRHYNSPNENGNNEELFDTVKNFASSSNRSANLLIARVQEDFLKKQPKLISALQDFVYTNYSQTKADKKKSIILILPSGTLIEELEPLVERMYVPFPDKEDIKEEFGFSKYEREKGEGNNRNENNSPYLHGSYKFAGSYMKDYEKHSQMTIEALLGMQLFEIRKLMLTIQAEGNNQINTFHPKFTSIKSRILSRRKQIVKNTGLLEIIEYTPDYYKNVGNIDGLVAYMKRLKIFMSHEKIRQLPKGVLLVGEPGCGKSESVKAIASILEIPLFRLNLGDLLGQYVGQSEHNFREALRTAEAAFPCILSIDEIEKAFSGAGSGANDDDKVMTRIMGIFLTWMQEHEKLVYLVATANDLSKMKSEFLRKGRWDEIFYLSMPKGDGLFDILGKNLKKNGLQLWDSNSNKGISHIKEMNNWKDFMADLEGMSGADIGSLIAETLRDVYGTEDKNRGGMPAISNEGKGYLPTDCLISNAKRMQKELKDSKEAVLVQQIEEEVLKIKINSRPKDLDEVSLKNNLRKLLSPKEWKDKENEYKSKGYKSAAGN